MKHAVDQYPLLYQLFLKIQQYDRRLGHLALGLKEFYVLVQALDQGLGMSDEQHFKKLVRWLWQKPHHDPQVFQSIMDSSLALIYEKSAERKEELEEKDDSQIGKGPKDTLSELDRDKTEQKGRTSSEEDLTSDTQTVPKAALEEDSLIISFEKASPDKDKAALQFDIAQLSEEINKEPYLLKGNYFELGSRQLQQGVRTMRRREVDKSKKLIDLEATIQKVSRQGFLECLEYRYGEKWTTDLTILIDQGDSMIAFEPFSEELISVVQKDKEIKGTVYFFKGTPYDEVFEDRLQRKGISIDQLSEAPAQSILVVSDAGAATGRIDEARVEDTVDFLAGIRKHRVAWLNPMPRERWRKTSAEYIALYTSMFFLDQTELVNVVKLFKAKMKSSTLLDKYVQEMY